MKTLGLLILIGGVCLGIFALSMDTTVKVNYPMGNSFGLPERVNNIGLMNDKQNYLIFSGILSVLGAIMYFYAKSRAKKTQQLDNGFKQCPQCAEKVPIAAKICRYCNSNFYQESNITSEMKQWVNEKPESNVDEYFAAKNQGKQNQFLEQMSKITDEELIKIIKEQRHEYQPEAVSAAEFEIAKRNLIQD